MAAIARAFSNLPIRPSLVCLPQGVRLRFAPPPADDSHCYAAAGGGHIGGDPSGGGRIGGDPSGGGQIRGVPSGGGQIRGVPRGGGRIREDHLRCNRTPVNWGINVVPETKTYVVERLGKYLRTLEAGVHLLVPGVDRIAYVHSTKQESIAIRRQAVLTRERVSIHIAGIIYVKIFDPFLASYRVENPLVQVKRMAEVAVTSELAKMSLNKTFNEREKLNERIVHTINDAASAWGVRCLAFYTKTISHPAGVKAAGLVGEAELVKKKKRGHFQKLRQLAPFQKERPRIRRLESFR